MQPAGFAPTMLPPVPAALGSPAWLLPPQAAPQTLTTRYRALQSSQRVGQSAAHTLSAVQLRHLSQSEAPWPK